MSGKSISPVSVKITSKKRFDVFNDEFKFFSSISKKVYKLNIFNIHRLHYICIIQTLTSLK